MNKAVLSQLLQNIADLNDVTRLQVLQDASHGQPRLALDALDDPTLSVDRSAPAWGALQMYLLHLAGQYAQANRVLDNMIGLDLSEQLSVENCPSESEIIARWNRPDSEAISIVCVTYNHERFIDMALAGFFSQQTTHPFEVVVRDDASTDRTVQILRRWQERYPRILRLEALSTNTYSQGIAAGRAGIDLARHPLVALCEGDDFWVVPDKLELQARLLVDNPSWSAVTHNHFELNESVGQLKVGREKLRTRGFIGRDDLMQVRMVLWVHTLMMRRSAAQLPHYNVNDGILGDQVLTAMLAACGPVFYMGDFVASVARRNLSSVYTPLSAEDKHVKRLLTRRFIAVELKRRGLHQQARRLIAWCDMLEAASATSEPVL